MRESAEDHELLHVHEVERDRRPEEFARVKGGMVERLRRQKAEGKRGTDLVYLGPEETMFLPRKDRPEMWEVQAVERDSVVLRRQLRNPRPPDRGFLRLFDLFGQTSLVKRRGQAIARLEHHTYLLTALRFPHHLYLDTGATELPLPIDRDRLDEAKDSAMHHIWRTRPIFALQGPPGTGKTTLVANLLGQIFKDDPVAQVLVSAQAHAAVDVLRDKVAKEIFESVPEEERPLAIRFQKSADVEDRDEDYVGPATERMLRKAVERIGQLSQPSRLQVRWRAEATEAIAGLASGAAEGSASDLRQLVKRSANITYCTTTAGDLAELAGSTQSFDWSIIEEAGKAHGFDLVLPLQSGHRWLLIGDQRQLAPYRYEDIQKALHALERVVPALYDLPDRAGGQVDIEVLNRWRGLEPDEQTRSVELWNSWLKVFSKLYEECAATTQFEQGPGAQLAQMLWEQHRMHPTIAELVSRAYYDDENKEVTTIQSRTVAEDGTTPVERVVHPFIAPADIAGKAILWLDVPWVGNGGRGDEAQRQGGYSAPAEVEATQRLLRCLVAGVPPAQLLRLAVLSPYRSQVTALSRALQFLRRSPPPWMETPRRRTASGFHGGLIPGRPSGRGHRVPCAQRQPRPAEGAGLSRRIDAHERALLPRRTAPVPGWKLGLLPPPAQGRAAGPPATAGPAARGRRLPCRCLRRTGRRSDFPRPICQEMRHDRVPPSRNTRSSTRWAPAAHTRRSNV